MSYLVLARKYRPKDFGTLVGQEHVVRALSNALDSNRLHHAYLFTGTRGIGKTTISRILAKAFNCEKGVTSQPCGECEACRAIDADRFVDYIEMDAASNRGVAEMTALLDQAVYAPTMGRFKVYMIDEVHMLTNTAFNSMLKTLEEPPEHVKFILATTDPQKIPVTVLSRCLQFNLRHMSAPQIAQHLSHVLSLENIPADERALQLIAKSARGSMRDALSLTDQAIAFCGSEIAAGPVEDMLGTLDVTYIVRILESIAAGDAVSLMGVADEMRTRSLSFAAALNDLAGMLHRIACRALLKTGDGSPEDDDIGRLAGLLDPQEVQLFYEIALRGASTLALAPDEYTGFTMTLLRMLSFRPSESAAQEPVTAAKAPAAASSAPSRPAPSAPARRAFAAPEMKRSEPARRAVPTGYSPEGEPPAGKAVPKAAPEKTAAGGDWDGDWNALVEKAGLNGIARSTARNCMLVDWQKTGNAVRIKLQTSQVLGVTATIENLLRKPLEEHFGCRVELSFEGGEAEHSARSEEKREHDEKMKRTVAAVRNDPLVKELKKEFGGDVVDGSVKAL